MQENKKRKFMLMGKTYNLKTPLMKHTLYITINDYNKRPFEIFFNTKDTSKFIELQIISRLISAIFRKVKDNRFILNELKSISNFENNGYFRGPRKGEIKGKYIVSLWYEIGEIIEKHFIHYI